MSTYKPARPPPGTPLARGSYGGEASPFELDSLPRTPNLEPHLEPAGSAVQSSILRSKLNNAQQDVQRLKRDVKAANEKALQLSLKLNEEKVAKVALTNKYSAVVTRVKEFDERMREAEEVIKNERQCNAELAKANEGLKEQVRQKQGAVEHHQALMKKAQKERDEEVKGFKETLDRSSMGAEAMRERQAQFITYVNQLIGNSMERLSEGREGNDAVLTVLASELTSTVTEQQQALQRIQLENETMRESLSFLLREVEEESNALVLTLLKENKDAYSELNHAKSELARFRDGERSRAAKLAESMLQDRIDALSQDNKTLEDKLRKANDTIRTNIEKGRSHEKTLHQVMEGLQASEYETNRLNLALGEAKAREADLQAQAASLEKQLAELRTEQHEHHSVVLEVRTLRERVSTLVEQHKKELVSVRAEGDREKDRLRDDLRHHTKLGKDAKEHLDRLEKELSRTHDALTTAKKQAEDDRSSSLAQLKEELALSKTMYERELEEARRDLESKGTELTNLQRVCDRERVESTTMRMEFGSLTKSVQDLRAENQQLHEETKRLMERNTERSREIEQRRTEAADYEQLLRQANQHAERATMELREEVSAAEQENAKLKHQLKTVTVTMDELEARRAALERENHSLTMLNSRGSKRGREDLERDKELLNAENQRILRQYEEVNAQNSRLLTELSKLRERCSNQQLLQDKVDMYRRQLEAMEHQGLELQDAREALSRQEGELDEVRKERNAIQSRLDSILEESSTLYRKEVELDQCVEAADMQIKRLEQQMERASRYTASIPRSSLGVTPSPKAHHY
eukprot:TRINITY_DN8919_c0_g1_i1.p1 TRINITY_DN8919_c0_g1~~TRINITY_DN8919_c0_g1_i1.p1  ORF type:complete len:810 (+),score=370.51 TRINITY_DN8919_c0_g1_i1:86-2515(+)